MLSLRSCEARDGERRDLEKRFVAFVPYCGAAPVPGALHWTPGPVLIFVLLVLTVGNLAFARLRAVPTADLIACFTGWVLLTLAFVSPLCSLSVALFSARAAQHMTITLIAAPLIARGLGVADWTAWRSRQASIALAATFVFALILWVWHSPALYDETLRSNAVYWLMHLTTVAAALAMWTAVFGSGPLLAFLILFATGVQMSLLGALLTFASVPLFSVHEFTTAAWGLTWIQDQQLGGLIMWAPAGLLLTAYSIAAFGAVLRLDAPAGSRLARRAA